MTDPALWGEGELPSFPKRLTEKDFRSLRYPLWTQNKARLIETYLRLFMFITKHGTYIDGFAAPQDGAHPNTWAAKLVLEMEPKWFRDFWLCDLKPSGVGKLRQLRDQHAGTKRRVNILEGDFNERVNAIFASGRIKERVATFALLDQRMFECEWQTVQALARHKAQGNKIELFYFFATGWIDRSLAAVALPETRDKVERWWERSDWASLRGMDGIERAQMTAKRFEKELGYGRADIYPIHDQLRKGRVMYHMIHATDHPEAFPLMVRAYRKVAGRPELKENQTQYDLLSFLQEVQNEGVS